MMRFARFIAGMATALALMSSAAVGLAPAASAAQVHPMCIPPCDW